MFERRCKSMPEALHWMSEPVRLYRNAPFRGRYGETRLRSGFYPTDPRSSGQGLAEGLPHEHPERPGWLGPSVRAPALIPRTESEGCRSLAREGHDRVGRRSSGRSTKRLTRLKGAGPMRSEWLEARGLRAFLDGCIALGETHPQEGVDELVNPAIQNSLRIARLLAGP